MNFLNLLKLDILRLFGLKLLFCSLIAFLLMTSVIYPFLSQDLGLWFCLSHAFQGTGTVNIVLCILPVIPYATTLADEWESNAYKSYVIRSGTKSYTLSKIASGLISGFLVVFLATLFFIFIYSFVTPVSKVIASDDAYSILASSGNLLGGYLLFATHISLSGSLIAVTGVWVSTFITNRYIAIASPLIMYYLMMVTSPTNINMPWILNPVFWIEGIAPADTATEQILSKLAVVIILCTLMSIGSVINMERKMRNA